MAKLILHSGTPQEREFELKAGTNSLGRGDDNDCKIDDPSVSTNHAQIIVNGNEIWIKDLGSTNGTFIDHSQVTDGVLQAGHALRLGVVDVVFEDNLPTAITVPAAAPVPARVRIAVPAATPEMAAPPAGKTNCKFHPKIAGEWLCQKCNELFCPVCVTIKRTNEGTSASCRKCGTACVPVKVNFVVPKEKKVKTYSEGVILLRCLGSGFGAAMLSALVWTGLSWLMGVDVPFLFCPMAGVICGYAVKLAAQDTPGPIFSTIAVVFCVIGSVLGKVGMIAVTHLTINTNTTYFTGALGLILGIYASWKIGGGE